MATQALCLALDPHLTLDAATALVAARIASVAALAALSVADIRRHAGLGLLPAKRLQAAAKEAAAKEAAAAKVAEDDAAQAKRLEAEAAKAAKEAEKADAEAPVRASLDSGLVDLLASNDLLLEVGPILIKEEVKTLEELEQLSAEDLESVGIKRASSLKLKESCGQEWAGPPEEVGMTAGPRAREDHELAV